MNIPKATDLSVYLDFLYRCLTELRSLALNKTSYEKIVDLIDAIHNLPDLLSDWEFFNEDLFLEYLSRYDTKWKCVASDFSLVTLYQKRKNIIPLQEAEDLLASEDQQLQDRIESLIRFFLIKIASTKDNKTALFRDKNDGRLWELYDLKGSDLYVRPFGLRLLSKEEALAKYDIPKYYKGWLL